MVSADKTQSSAKSARPIPYFLIGAIASLLVTAAITWLAYGHFVEAAEQDQLENLVQIEAEKRAEQVSQWLIRLNQDIAQFSDNDALAEAVGYQDQDRIESFRRSFNKAFPNAKSVNYFARGKATLAPDAEPPINFIQMDLILRAEARESTAIEAVNSDSGWAIQLAAGLPSNIEKSVQGTMLVTLDTTILLDALRSLDNSLGQTTLKQNYKSARAIEILSIGSADSTVTKAEKIANSDWEVEFSPAYGLMLQAAVSPIPLIAGAAVFWLLLLIASGVLTKTLQKRQSKQRFDKAHDKAMMTTKASKRNEVLDVFVKEEDKSLLGMSQKKSARSNSSVQGAAKAETNRSADLPLRKIFRAYDIRGVVGDQLTPSFAETLGRAIGSEALEQGESCLVVGRDGRIHSEELCQNLVDGILSTGCDVINIGLVPSPLLYFACETIGRTRSGIIVTASHNPGEYNGFKMVINGATLTADSIDALYTRIDRRQFRDGSGSESQQLIEEEYIERIFSDVALAGDIKIVIDAGNGATSEIAPKLFAELGCEVEPLFCEIDGRFPNHNPDPSRPENLTALIDKVKESGADLGVAFDGDGDRLTVVTPKGEIIWPDRLLMLFAKDIVSRNPGADVLFDVKSTRQLNSLITSYGGRPIMWKTGHSNMKQKMVETGALLGGELSGHIFIKDRWYGFDDGMYAAARLLEIMTLRDQDIDSIFSAFPMHPSTPEILLEVDDGEKFEIVKKLVAGGDFQGGKLTTIDGLRVDFAKGWGLVRASNTSPALTLRFEADNQETLDQLIALFKREMKKVIPELELKF